MAANDPGERRLSSRIAGLSKTAKIPKAPPPAVPDGRRPYYEKLVDPFGELGDAERQRRAYAAWQADEARAELAALRKANGEASAARSLVGSGRPANDDDDGPRAA